MIELLWFEDRIRFTVKQWSLLDFIPMKKVKAGFMRCTSGGCGLSGLDQSDLLDDELHR